MTARLLERLATGRVLVADGAFGTQLQVRGMATGQCPEEYNTSHPHVVQGIYRDYFKAGADFVSTNSFGGNRARLARHGFADRVAEFASKAVELAREVCPQGGMVAGSVGPTGEVLEPFGAFPVEQAQAAFAEQCQALADGGADFILIETMMALEEALAALRAAKESTSLPVAVTMTFEARNDQFRTSWGVSIQQAAEALTQAGADLIGSNCGQGFDNMVEIARLFRAATRCPIIAQANAGLPQWVDGKAVYKETPESIAPKVEALLAAGVNVIGGCCGTGPEHIARIRAIVNARS
jgi:5-methyltetrahydrofolate--homocysteine methyltransferase